MIILKQKNRLSIWKAKVWQAAKISLIGALSITVLSIIVSLLYADGIWMNWSDSDSFASKYTGAILKDQSIVLIIITFFVILYMQIFFSILIILISNHVFHNYLWGFAFLIINGINDMNGFLPPLLFGRFTIQRNQWLFLKLSDYYVLPLLFFINVIVYALGRGLAEKRDFL